MIQKIITRTLITLVTVVLFVTLLLQSSVVKDKIVNYAVAVIEEKTGWDVEIGDAKLYLPVQVTLNEVSVSEKGKPLFQLRHADVIIIPFDFLYGKFIFHSIHINDLDVRNLPEPVAINENINTPKWDWLNLILKVNDLRVSNFTASKPLLEQLQVEAYAPIMSPESPLSIKGRLVVDPMHQCITGNFTLVTSQSPKAESVLTFSCLQEEKLLGGKLNITAASDGVLLSPLGLHGGGEGELSGNFSASIDTWKKLYLKQQVTEKEAVTGSIQLEYNDDEQVINLATEFDLTTSNFLHAHHLAGSIGPVTIDGEFSYGPTGVLDGSLLQFTIDDENALEQWVDYPLIGKLSGNLELSGPIKDPHMELSFISPKLSFDDYEITNLKTQITTKMLADKMQGDVSLAFHKYGRDFVSSATVDFLEEDIINLHNLSIQLPRTKLVGYLTVELPTKAVSGELSGSVNELLEYEELWEAPISGAVRFKTQLSHSEKTGQSAVVSIMGRDLSLGDIKAENSLASVTLEHIDTTPTGKISAQFEHVTTKDTDIETVVFSTDLTQDVTAWPYQLSITGANKDKISGHSTGFWHYQENIFSLKMNTLEGLFTPYTFSLNHPFSITFSPEGLKSTPLEITSDKGSLFAQINSTSYGIDGVINVKNIPLQQLQLLYPDLPATGTFSMETTLKGKPENPEGQLQITIEDMLIQEESFAKLPPMQAHLAADIVGGRMICSGWLTGIGDKPAQLRGNFPVSLSLAPPSFHLDQDKKLEAQMSASGMIAPLLELFILETTNIEGHISFDVNISGTLNDPHVTGHANFTDGAYEGPNLGVTLNNIQATLEANGPRVILKEISASDTSDGKITGTGHLIIDKRQGYPYELLLDVDGARIIRLDQVSAKMSGNAQLKGNIDSAIVSGELRSNRFRINLAERTKEITQTIDVTFINAHPGSIQAKLSETLPKHWPLNLDLKINVPEASVKGQGLDSYWRGQAIITGTTEDPLVDGTFKITEGSYRFQGKTFEMNEGSLTIDGDPGKKTSIYVIAGMDIDRMRVEAILRGPIKEPALSFRSNPPMSQREILSWILFNRGLSNLTPFQGTELNESITDLNMGDNGPDLLTKLRGTLGIDRIDISSDETSAGNAVSVRVGKYISKGTFVSIGKNMTTDTNTVSVEMTLFRDFKLEGQISDDKSDQLNLIWRHDY